MRTSLKLAVALGLAAFLTSSQARAQGFGGRGMMGGGGGLNLLTNSGVQKELKLSDEQIEKAKKAQTEMSEKMREKFSELQNLDAGERQQKMQTVMKEMNDETKKVASGILTADQTKRFDQISLQVQGFQAFNSPDIQKKLGITDEQKEKLQTLGEEMRSQMPTREDMQADREAATKKRETVTKETKEKAMNILTDSQKATYKEMTGAPFDYKPEMPRRPGGGQ